MKISDLKSLKKNAQKKRNIGDLLQEGESGWLVGKSVESDNETVSLGEDNGVSLTVKANHVLEIREHEDLFYIRIKVNTPVLIRTETISNVSPVLQSNVSSCGCNDDKKETTGVSAKRISSGNGLSNSLGSLFNNDPCQVCTYKWVEGWCYLDKTTRIKCYKYVQVCENVCMPA